MNAKTEDKIEIILHYDLWDNDGERLPAAPIEGLNEAGNPIRTQTTLVAKDLAKKMVEIGKASVPLKL